MPVLIDTVPLIPAPLVTINKSKETAADGTDLASTYQITLRGNIVAVPPGTSPIDADERLGVLIAKQEELSELFSVDGRLLEILSPDGSLALQCNPRLLSMDFSEGIWFDRVEYTINLEAYQVFNDDDFPAYYVQDITDEWNVEEAGFTTVEGSGLTPLWTLTHNVSARGLPYYDTDGVLTQPWTAARDWVLNRLTTSNFATSPINSSTELNLLAGGTAYNHIRTQDINIAEGTFGVRESWVLARGLPASEDYTVSVRRTPNESTVITVNVSGTVRGLATGINTLETRMANAIAYFDTHVKAKLPTRAQSLALDTTLSDYGVSGSLDYNYAEGTISYSYDFSDQPTAVGDETVYDVYTVSRRSNIDSSETVVQVQGTITGRLEVGETNSTLLKYQRAKTYWDTVGNTTFMLVRAAEAGVAGLKPSATETSVDFNFFEGSITYSFEFNNRNDDLARNEYTTSLRTSREENRATVSVDGTITGLRSSDTSLATEKYTNALAFWTTWEPQIFATAEAFAPIYTLNTEPAERSRGDNPYAGTINYGYTFNTDAAPTIPDAVSEQITVSDNHPSDVFAVIPVLGRLSGPILQDISAKKERSRTVTIEAVMAYGAGKPDPEPVYDLYAPIGARVFIDRDEESWVPNLGRFSSSRVYIWES